MRDLTPRTLAFPLAGINRSGDYRRQERPYATPYAVNVRGHCPFYRRHRGGSRPGLVKVTAESKETLRWRWPNGGPITWTTEDGYVEYDAEVATLQGGGYKIVPFGETPELVVEKGAVPTPYGASCFYRDRRVVVVDNAVYFSRVNEHTDFDYAYHMEDDGRAALLALGQAGQPIRDKIIALIPFKDSLLYMATRNAIYMLEGDPNAGQLKVVSEYAGIVSEHAWAANDTHIIALSNSGLLYGEAGGTLARFSERVLPNSLLNYDGKAFMAWDSRDSGWHVFLDKPEGYWIDGNMAVWQVAFANEDFYPTMLAKIESANAQEIALLGSDGVWRKFEKGAEDDCGEPIASAVTIAVLPTTRNDLADAMIVEIHGLLDPLSGEVRWMLVTDTTSFNLQLPMLGIAPGMMRTGSWEGGRNQVDRVRQRGTWAMITLFSDEAWAFEGIVIKSKQLGRLRE